ncbi:hypothetical protein LTS17_008570 [Exophiala oligosperma]
MATDRTPTAFNLGLCVNRGKQTSPIWGVSGHPPGPVSTISYPADHSPSPSRSKTNLTSQNFASTILNLQLSRMRRRGTTVSPGMHQYVSAMIDDDIDMSGPQSGGRNRWKMPKTSRSPIKTDDVPERAKFYSSHSANKKQGEIRTDSKNSYRRWYTWKKVDLSFFMNLFGTRLSLAFSDTTSSVVSHQHASASSNITRPRYGRKTAVLLRAYDKWIRIQSVVSDLS